MSYLEEFKTQIINRDFPKFFQLWEEYCNNDTVDVEEFVQLLQMIKSAEVAKPVGGIIETALPLWRCITDKKEQYEVLKHIIDLQTTQSETLAELTLQFIKDIHGQDPLFNERLRLVGLRSKENFQGAISNYDLLAHMKVGNFVFHHGGWGTGEIMEISPVREQIAVEFENVSGRKHITFSNAFKTLIPINHEHFLARRFADPDTFEQEARENPVAIIKLLIQDVGPKSAAEIKDELCELVIPEKDWTKWWQGARAKIKKDPMIETPDNLKDPFRLRKAELSQEDRLKKAMKNKSGVEEVILSTYNFMRDLPNAKKHQDITKTLLDQTVALLSQGDLTPAQELQIYILLEIMFSYQVEAKNSEFLVRKHERIDEVINAIDILALKKRAMHIVRECRPDWAELFLKMLLAQQQSAIRDYLLKELNQGSSKALLVKNIQELVLNPTTHPEFVAWYFHKIVAEPDSELPFSSKKELCKFFEAFLILFSFIENKPEYRELSKKMYNLLSGKRYAVVRSIIEGTEIDFIKEFLLLVAKCQSLTDHDIKNLHSLAQVVHPSLAKSRQQKSQSNADGHTIWTTEAGYTKTQERLKQIATKEMIENAREVEAARALGDLRENSEYKFAVEKRHRLQGEMKSLSDMLNKARVITKDDIFPDEVSVGSVVSIKNDAGQVSKYTILGPWDADAESNILSFQSKLAQAMIGSREGDTFQFKDEDYTIESIRNIFDK